MSADFQVLLYGLPLVYGRLVEWLSIKSQDVKYSYVKTLRQH